MMKSNRIFPLMACLLAAGTALSAEPSVRQSDDALTVDLGNGAVLGFALHDGRLLGLQSASVDGKALTSNETLQRPIMAQDHGQDRHIIQSYRLRQADVRDGRVVIELEAIATSNTDDLEGVFVMRGNRERAQAEQLTPELERLRNRAAEAEARLDQALLQHDERLRELHNALREAEQALEGMSDDHRDTHVHAERLRNRNRARQRYGNRRRQVLPELLESRPDLAEAAEAMDAWDQAVDERVMDFAEIHRDYYRFPIWRQPGEINTLDAVTERAEAAAQAGRPVGTVRWIIEPHTEAVAGWPWLGWRQWFEIDLDDVTVNHIAVLGTWELGGQAAGNTMIALRYRGLGGLVQPLSDRGDGTVPEPFSTTEIIPGAAGGAPLVSPVVSDGEHDLGGDREFALRHRVGAWIAQPARGAGAPFIDVQYRDGALLAAVPQRQGNIRAVTEVMPGDSVISQTDLEYFALSSTHKTIPMHYLVLEADGRAFDTAEIRTRYQELDQHVRDAVSEELGFVQYEVLPGAHYMLDHNFGGQVRSLAENLPRIAAEGARRIETHHPGWVNGRVRNPGMEHIGGGVCDIYDYWPLREVKNPWKALTEACAEHDVAYYVWLTGMCRIDGPMHKRVGTRIERWAFNEPHPRSLVEDSTGYMGNSNFNIHNDVTREVLLEQIDKVQREFGYQGLWADSYQNLFMSQLDWAQGTGDSLQRTWWEIISQWSRDGISWTAESHSFPGQSCSIENQQGWDRSNFFLTTHVNRAFRAHSFPHSGEPAADRIAFGFMANKGWAAPDLRPHNMPSSVVPSFKRLAHEYLAALPLMRRSYQLPDDAGVLWLGYEDDSRGVLFSMADADVPAGVTASPILDDGTVESVSDLHTYGVAADDLLEAFGIRRGPLDDERIGREWTAPEYAYPDWATE